MRSNNTILIVDDKPGAREVLKGLLIGKNYHLAFAGNGREALDKAVELTPELILLDVMMPDMSGFEVCRTLRANPILRDTSIIIITALDDLQSRVEGIEAGADDFISKPFSSVELLARIRTTMRLNRYRHLHQERAKFEWVIQKANFGCLVVDEDDNIHYANPQARLYLGLPPDETAPLTTPFLDLARQHYRCEPEHAWETWPAISGGANPPRYLIRPQLPPENPLWLQVDTQKLPHGWGIHLNDVSSRMGLQKDLWEFQSVMADKLRTPLSSVVTGLTILKSYDMTKYLNEELANLLEMIFYNAQRLDRGTQDLLSKSAQEQPGQNFHLEQLPPMLAQIGAHLGFKIIFEPDETTLNGITVGLPEQIIELLIQETSKGLKKLHPQQTSIVQVQVQISPSDQNKQIRLQLSSDDQILSSEQVMQAGFVGPQNSQSFPPEAIEIGASFCKAAQLIWSIGGTYHLRNRTPGPGITVDFTLPALASG